MPSATKQELHLAKSLDELKKRSEITNFGKKTIERIIEFANKFYQIAINHQQKGDSESAYMFYYRFLTLLSYIDNENDRKKFSDKIGTKANDVMNQLESLTEELSMRYAEKRKNYEDRKAKLFNNTNNKPLSLPGNAVKIDKNDINNDDDDECYRTISCKELIQYIMKMSEINKILIIDIRPVELFNDSSIAANKIVTACEINIINIPNDIIMPGLTFPQLKKKISFGVTQDCLERRRSMDNIVIVDEKTYEFDKKSKSCLLADAFWKWDESPDKIKNKPLLLRGGYHDFVLTYPTFTTNPVFVSNFNNSSMNLSFNKSKSNFYNFLDEDNVENKNNDNINRTPLSNILNNGQSIQNKNTENNNSNLFVNQPIKIPGIARPIIPDRSSKPALINTNKKQPLGDHTNKLIQPIINDKNTPTLANQTRIIDRNNLPPKPAHLISSISNGDDHRINGNSSLDSNEDDDEVVDNKFNPDMMIESSAANTRDKNEVFPMDEEMSDYENNINNNEPIDIDSDDESTTKPTHMNYRNNECHNNQPFSSSLSRSLSSPNIAQFEPSFHYNDATSPLINNHSNSPKFSPQTPLIDRSMKPFMNNFRKTRDFSPQFSSCARIVGLKNLGNTCFMNSMLQCLKNTKELYEFLVAGNVHINPNSKFGSNGELTIELIELFKQMRYPSNFKNISPKDFKCAVSRHIPDFTDYKQQDAHEFLVRLLDRLHADLNQSKPDNYLDPIRKDPNYYDKFSIAEAAQKFWASHIQRNNSFITNLFEGLIVSTITCLHCQASSKSLEAFTCLTLPIPENVGRTTLQNCINLFLRGELLSNEVAWQCQSCKQKRDAQKCTYIWRLPKILIIHLKRFTYDGMWRQKISNFVDFPIENLKIETANNEMHKFSLYGVVNHFGSLEGGHYVAYSRNCDSNIDWHRYDDQDVSPMSSSDVVTQNAYVLFYRSV